MINQRENQGLPWVVVFIALCVFWPVGLYLLIKKCSVDKKATFGVSGKVMKVIGIIILVFVAVGLLGFCINFFERGYESSDASGIIGVLFVAAGGVALLLQGNKVCKNAERIKLYLSVIVNGNMRKISEIASATGNPQDVVFKDLRMMITKGFLPNAFIDEGKRKLVLSGDEAVKEEKARVINCACCGANNTVYGDMNECEYCGSPLKK